MSEPSLSLGELSLTIERLPIAGEFRIARGAKTHAEVLVAAITRGGVRGRGEAVPYGRYGETASTVLALAEAHASALARVPDRSALRSLLAAGALRNAIDLALHDLEARLGAPSLPREERVRSALTLSLAAPEAMAQAAERCPGDLLKLKLAGDGHDAARLEAVHAARPDAELWLDANEGLDVARYEAIVPLLERLPVVLLEQPFPAASDAVLRQVPRPVPICADESLHGETSFDALADRYDAVNVKLDKSGGLTSALDHAHAAREAGLDVVVGCMVASSLAIAPAFALTPLADFVDLDGALFLAADREGGTQLDEDGWLRAPARSLWAG